MVFVLDKKKRPLMPCTERRARLLLQRGRAVVHRLRPFTIRLKDRLLEDSVLQPVVLKIDPGSQTTGMAIVREEETPEGPVHYVLHFCEVKHKGGLVADRMRKRAAYRRRRRVKNLRHRPPRFDNRRRPPGWLTPCMKSRVGNVLSWVKRYSRWVPITRMEMEYVKFDLQKLQDPEISGVEYQQGELQGYEVREYLLEKWGRKCAYCGAEGVPLTVDHIVPKSQGGSDRPSNLASACLDCNGAKGTQDIREFLADRPDLLRRILAQAQEPLKDASAVNVARQFILRGLQALGWEVTCWSGGRTKWNRSRLGLPKTHALDALCVGEVAKVSGASLPVLIIQGMGRGVRCRTNVDAHGFPRSYLLRQKSVHGFQTGDLVRAEVPQGKRAGVHIGRVTVRRNGSFRVGKNDGISWRRCRLLQRADGYAYEQKEGLVK